MPFFCRKVPDFHPPYNGNPVPHILNKVHPTQSMLNGFQYQALCTTNLGTTEFRSSLPRFFFQCHTCP